MAEQVLGEGDAARAAGIFSQIRDMAPDDAQAAGGLAYAMVAAGRADEARALLDSLSPEMAKHAAVSRAGPRSMSPAPPADVSAEEARVKADPDDHEARFVANALMAAGDRDGAAEALLEIIGRDKEWNGGAARSRFLQLLEAAGFEDPGRGRSGAGCRRCCSRDGRKAGAGALVPAGRGDPVPARNCRCTSSRTATGRWSRTRSPGAGASP